MPWYTPDPEYIAERNARIRAEVAQVCQVQDAIVQVLLAAGESCAIMTPRWKQYANARAGFDFHTADYYHGSGFALYYLGAYSPDRAERYAIEDAAIQRYKVILARPENQHIPPYKEYRASLSGPRLGWRIFNPYQVTL